MWMYKKGTKHNRIFLVVVSGHGGARAAEYVKQNLFSNLIRHPKFISDTKSAIGLFSVPRVLRNSCSAGKKILKEKKISVKRTKCSPFLQLMRIAIQTRNF